MRLHRIVAAGRWFGAALVSMLVMLMPNIVAGQSSGSDSSGSLSHLGELPLTPARVVRFRVTEGTWMSLDVSPDGRTIVFDCLGDLYRIPISGGPARQLTSGLAINRQPRYSPDGRHLVFVSDRGGSANVWIADYDGRHPRQLSALQGDWEGNVSSPAWSPDGETIVVAQKLAATRAEGPGSVSSPWWLLAAYDVGTGRMRWVSDTAPDRARSTLGPAFSRTARTLYAGVDGFRSNPWIADENWRIAQVDLVTGAVKPEMGPNTGRIGVRPAVSPNGRYLVYASSSGSHPGFRVRDLRTDRERWLVREVLDDMPLQSLLDSRDLVPAYSFTPDSRALVAAYGGKIRQIDIATGRSWVIPFVVDVQRQLGGITVHQFALPDTAARVRNVMHPALSPDAQWVAFSALDRIWMMELPHDGRPVGQPWRATADSIGEFYPSWSPDGQSIVYSTWTDGEGGAVRRVPVTHEQFARPPPSVRLTTDTAIYFHTAVAPDGERVVAVRAVPAPERLLVPSYGVSVFPRDPTLVWIPISGGVPQTIASLKTQYSRYQRYPVDQVYVTTDPTRIYVGFTSWRWDGTDQQMALTITRRGEGSPWGAAGVAGVFSIDQSRALVSIIHQRTLFELGLPATGGGPPDTLDLARMRTEPLGAAAGAAARWGATIDPWISWSRSGRRVLFNQGSTLFVGDVQSDVWTTFTRVDVPLVVPMDRPGSALLLRGARLITMREGSEYRHEVIERGDLLVRGNRIAAIGAAGTVPIPAGAQLLDVTGTTILPGYVDIHDHIALPKGIHAQQPWECLVRLAYGVTAIREPNPAGHDEFTYGDRERAGDVLCPRIFTTGFAYNETDPPIRSLDDAREAVRPNAEYFSSETFKVYPTGSGNRTALQLLSTASAEAGLNATVEGASNAVRGLGVIIDGFSGLEHTFPIRIYDDLATLIARSGTTHTQTYGLWSAWIYMTRRHGGLWESPKMRRFIPPSARTTISRAFITSDPPRELDNLVPLVSGAARIVARGGRVGVGSHGNIPGLGFHYEMWSYALGRMPNHDILLTATIVGARAIGHARDFGSLEPGKLADLQILERNPLEDIQFTTSIRYVMKQGRLYRAEDLTETWPDPRPLAATYRCESTVAHEPSPPFVRRAGCGTR